VSYEIDREKDRINYISALRKKCAGLEAERDRLRLENEVLESMSRHSPSPCGHSSQYAYTEDGGKHIICLLCLRARHAALVEAIGKCSGMLKPGINEEIAAIEELNAALAEVKG
jgi:hypothetical protein